MSPAGATGECAGWFGKIPSLGDFATRRLPPAFVGRWDVWLSGELSEARDLLGDRWLAIYQQAPVWCFCLGVGTVDERAWQGIIVPSFDRVGRQFPLTIAMSRLPDSNMAGPAMPATWEWWAALVEVGQRALEPGCGADGVDAALSALAVAQAGPWPVAIPGAGKSAWLRWAVTGPVDAPYDFVEGLPRGLGFHKLLGLG